MKPQEMANRLNGREYRDEVTRDDEIDAKNSGLVIVVGASDDLMELYGAIRDEVSCYDGGTAYLTRFGLLENKCDCEDCPYHLKELETATKIKAVWNSDGYSWTYETDMPHAVFDILEDGEKYCRGIVFNLGEAQP